MTDKLTVAYSELHTHSCGSLKDAHSRVDKLVARAKENNQKSVALTDHGTLTMIPSLFRECAKAGIKPIAGCEGYLTDIRGGDNKTTENYHQLYLVKNEAGWKNLMKLVSEAYATGFHNRPRADWELLEKHSEGLIATSSCLMGMIPQAILKGELKEARKLVQRFVNIFGDDFYLEIQPTPQAEQYIVNRELIKISHEMGVKLVATGDVHYVNKDDKIAHQGMLCLGRGKKMLNEDTPEYPCEEYYYMKTAKEMFSLFVQNGLDKKDVISAINNTQEIVDKVDFQLTKIEGLLPEFPVPEGTTADKLIAEMVKEGLMRKVYPVTKQYVDRIKFELSVIRQKGFQDYFLVVADAIKFCKQEHIITAPARGSAGGSLVAYCLDITEVDPIQHGLYFERFLDITRTKFPDIDSDVEDVRRYELIEYLREKYGRDKVAQIVNTVYMSAKVAYKNALQVYDIPFGESQRISNLVPDGVTLEEAYQQVPELKKFRTSKEKIKRKGEKGNIRDYVYAYEVAQMAERFEGVLSHFGKHAGGVLITPTPITDYFPTFVPDPNDKSNVVTMWHKDEIEQYGGIKFDFLGLKTLRVIGLTLESILKETGERINILEIAKLANDPLVYEKIARGDTANTFQFSSSGMQQLCKAVKPTEFHHLVAINALYRPPALASGDTWKYADIKNGKEEEHYSHPDEKRITGETFGIITYQEHVMEIVHTFAGWDYGRGDKLRKASADELEAMRTEFVEDCVINRKPMSTEKEISKFANQMNELWDRIVRYMGYGFNKSHGVAYSMISYMTAWLETHYPAHYQAALMSTKMSDLDKVAQIFQDVKREGFDFTAPDINKSGRIFTASNNKIVFPLSVIKGVGDGAVKEILAYQPFDSMEDLMERCNLRVVSARAMKPLIYSGAFDELYPNWDRRMIYLHYMNLKNAPKKSIREIEDMEWNDEVKAKWEKDLLGVYISTHPLARYHFKNWQEFAEGYKDTLIGGVITKVKSFQDKNQRRMAFVNVDTLQGIREVVVFADVYKKYEKLLVEKQTVMLTGVKQSEKLLLNRAKELN